MVPHENQASTCVNSTLPQQVAHQKHCLRHTCHTCHLERLAVSYVEPAGASLVPNEQGYQIASRLVCPPEPCSAAAAQNIWRGERFITSEQS
eukprot:186966-Chlamydomonas_euryale.AAC.2